VVIARSLTDSSSGIRLLHAPGFIAAELAATPIALPLPGWLFPAGPHLPTAPAP
jgi:hypothetical protein